jgi:hypothetical protein
MRNSVTSNAAFLNPSCSQRHRDDSKLRDACSVSRFTRPPPIADMLCKSPRITHALLEMRFQTSRLVIRTPFRMVAKPRISLSSFSSKLRRSTRDARVALKEADTSWVMTPCAISTRYVPKYAENSSCASGGLLRPFASLRRPLMSRPVTFPLES